MYPVTGSHSRRLESSETLLWELQILHVENVLNPAFTRLFCV